jgi:hypothetical protein
MLNIHSTLIEYASAYQGALDIKKEAEKTAFENLIGVAYAEEMGKINDAFQSVVNPLREKSMNSIKITIADARKSIQNVVSIPMDTDVAKTIDVIRNLPNVTLTEKESVFERCAGNYMATRLCIDALKLEGEHLPPRVDDVLQSLDMLESATNTFFNSSTFDTDATYMARLVMNSDYTASIISEITLFVETFK